MADHKTHVARLAKRRAHKPLQMADLLKILTSAIREAEAVLYRAAVDEDAELTLKAVHAVSQCCGQYSRLIEIGEFESSIAALEAAVQGRAA